MKRMLLIVALLGIGAATELLLFAVSHTQQELLNFFNDCNQGVKDIYGVGVSRN